MSIDEAFGIAVKELMKENNISRLKLTRLTNISNTSLYMIEKGEQSPTLDTINKIAKAFNMSPGKLVSKANQLMI